MNKKQKYILIAIVFALVVLCSGLTYAYFTSATPSESGSTIYAKGGTMNIKYANGSGNIVMSNIYPREAEWVNKTFTVTGNNTTDLEMSYRLYITTSSNGFNFGDLTYTLSGTSTNTGDTLISKTNENIPKAGTMLLGTGTFKSKQSTHSYNLKIYYKSTNDNQNNGQGKNYTGFIRIDNGNALSYDSLVSIKNNSTQPESLAFNGPITRNQVESITFNNNVSVPSDAIASWDVSDKQNGSIIAYTLDTNNNNLYEVYIGQENKVILTNSASQLFQNYNKSTTLDVSNLDTSKVTDMSYMFAGSTATTITGLNKLDTSNVTNMFNMFYKSSATDLDLSTFNTSKVTTMSGMFSGSKAISINLSSFNTSLVEDMSDMFYESKATVLDLSSFDTSNVSDISNMFYSCSAKTGYARTQTDADKLNSSGRIPSGLKFVVKN